MLFTVLVLGIGLQVVYRFLMTKNVNAAVIWLIRSISWLLVMGAAVLLVFLSPQVFRDANGQACAMVMSFLLPWIVDNFLGSVFNCSCHKKLLVWVMFLKASFLRGFYCPLFCRFYVKLFKINRLHSFLLMFFKILNLQCLRRYGAVESSFIWCGVGYTSLKYYISPRLYDASMVGEP